MFRALVLLALMLSELRQLLKGYRGASGHRLEATFGRSRSNSFLTTR